ncbi:unnamed protein product [Prorocentrum cordatum]|uniref:Kinesin-like protein n=1 Tax=Prorocentrum cordatum TaxID=2364126 RepID=A0ABN9W211_9DINO|nr:unnamed protein product [Polarella glacialis]
MQQARDRFDETGMPSVFDGTLHSTATTRSEGLRSVSVFCLDDLERISRSCLQNRAIGTSTQHEESSRSHAVLRMEIVTQAVLDARQALDDARALLPAFQNALDNLTNVACKLLFERDPYGRYNAIGCTDPCGRCSAEGPAPDPIWDPEDSGGLRRRHFREPGLWESRHAALRAQRRGLEESLAGARAEAKRASGALAALLERGPASLGGSLVLVDLAGADYDHRAGAQQRESAEINKSLLALKDPVPPCPRQQVSAEAEVQGLQTHADHGGLAGARRGQRPPLPREHERHGRERVACGRGDSGEDDAEHAAVRPAVCRGCSRRSCQSEARRRSRQGRGAAARGRQAQTVAHSNYSDFHGIARPSSRLSVLNCGVAVIGVRLSHKQSGAHLVTPLDPVTFDVTSWRYTAIRLLTDRPSAPSSATSPLPAGCLGRDASCLLEALSK